jgi:YD repeat-containing protein
MREFKIIFGFCILGIIVLCLNVTHAATITYTYDNLSRLTRVVYGDGTTEEFTYDAAGNRLTHIVTVSGLDTTPPEPNPMTWATLPYGASSTSISMVTTAATDSDSPPVSYYFSFVDSPTGGTGGADSVWQSGASYTNSGLQPNHQYGYQVKARDSASTPNETSYSSIAHIYTLANSPGSASFSNVTETSIRANWTGNGNRLGTEYFCENTTKGTNSGWTSNTYWDSTGLACGTPYSFRVKARNGDGIETGWTFLGSQITQACPIDTTPPQPNPMTWVASPYAASFTAISMVATTATDSSSPPVSYYFDFVDSPTGGTGGTDSVWQSGASYTNSGLQPNHQYGYRVKARDSASTPNETSYSSTVYRYTLANAPAAGFFSNVTQNCIRVNWGANGNPGGTQYFCENSTNNTNSSWTNNLYWDSCSLTCNTSYSFRVKARNGDGAETDWVLLGSQLTGVCAQPFPFVDDFSTDKSWVGYESGGWERKPAIAGGGENGNPDPGTDHSATADNYVLGFAIGADYPDGLVEKSLISPPINCTGQTQVYLKFWRYLNVESNYDDHAKIYVSNDGINWNQLWENPVFDLIDNKWTQVVFDISSIATNQANVYIKFSMGPTNSTRRFSGWNIDDLEVTSVYCGPMALYAPYGDTSNPNIDEMLTQEGFGIRHSNDIPGDLSNYSLMILHRNEACSPSAAASIKSFVQYGGGAIIMGECPKYLAGNTEDLSSISDWFGAGAYGTDGGYASVTINHPFGTDLLVGDKVDYLSSNDVPSVISLNPETTAISTWASFGKTHSFIHSFGQGRVFYYAGDPGYCQDPDQQIVLNSLTLFEEGLLWTTNLLPEISVSPPSKDFGSVDVGNTSSPQTFTVSNTSKSDLIIGTLSITGTDASQFTGQNDTCSGQTIVPSSTCTVDVVFSPTSAGTKNASLSIPSNDPDTSTLNVSLTGTGALPPKIGYSPVSFSFLATQGGSNPPTQTLSITNTGSGTLNWLITDNATWLSLTPTSGTNSGTVTVAVDTTGLTVSTYNATITITASGATNSPVNIPVILTVTLPDLVETTVSNPPATVRRGGSFSVTDTTNNQGIVGSKASITGYYLSTDNLKDGVDTLLTGSRRVPALAAGAISTGTVTVTIPTSTVLGTYYLLACADDTNGVAETNENNNCIASSTTVQVSLPDLLETTVSNPPATVRRGGSFSVTDTTKNQGIVGSKASTTRYYLSTDTVKDSADKLLKGTRSVPALAAEAISTGTVMVTIQNNAVIGTYYLLACADDKDAVDETNESNNCISSNTKMQIIP